MRNTLKMFSNAMSYENQLRNVFMFLFDLNKQNATFGRDVLGISCETGGEHLVGTIDK